MNEWIKNRFENMRNEDEDDEDEDKEDSRQDGADPLLAKMLKTRTILLSAK